MPKKADFEKWTYNQTFTELEKVIETLETGQQSLEESMQLFERGQALARHCMALLDHAELKIQQLENNAEPASDEPLEE